MKINKLIFDKNSSGIYFGQSVAINSGDISFVGAYKYGNTGTVFVYKKFENEWSWNEMTRINLNDQSSYEGFGFSLSSNYQGNILAVGSPFKNRGDGLVSIFTGNGSEWNKAYQISGVLSGGEYFGFSLSFNPNGDKLIIGTNTFNNQTGKAYLYSGSGNNWNLITGFFKNDGLLVADGSYKSYYGNKVAINSGDVILINSTRHNNSGAIFIYTGQDNIWQESQKLTGNSDLIFGQAFYINKKGDTILVGLPNALNDSGLVNIYQKSGSSWEKKYSISGETNNLGKCLFINESGDSIFASENGNNGKIYNYIKYNNNWYKNLTIENPNPSAGQYFGNRFTLDNNATNLLIGLPNFSYGRGHAYVYSEPWTNTKEYFGLDDIDISGSNCLCDEILECSDCCGVTPSFTIVTGYFNNLNQLTLELNISIKNNNCSQMHDIYSIYSNGIKIYNNIYQTRSFGMYNNSITLKNVKTMNHLLNLELKAQNLGKYYTYYSGTIWDEY